MNHRKKWVLRQQARQEDLRRAEEVLAFAERRLVWALVQDYNRTELAPYRKAVRLARRDRARARLVVQRKKARK